MKNRSELLEDLIYMRLPINEVLAELSYYSWDSDEIYIVVVRDNVINILESVLHNKISLQDLEDWANAIESREDLNFESIEIENIIEELANPVLYGELNENVIRNYLSRLL